MHHAAASDSWTPLAGGSDRESPAAASVDVLLPLFPLAPPLPLQACPTLTRPLTTYMMTIEGSIGVTLCRASDSSAVYLCKRHEEVNGPSVNERESNTCSQG